MVLIKRVLEVLRGSLGHIDFSIFILKLLGRHLWLHLFKIELFQENLTLLVNLSAVLVDCKRWVPWQSEKAHKLLLVVKQLVKIGREVLNFGKDIE